MKTYRTPELPPEFFALEVMIRDMYPSEIAEAWAFIVSAGYAMGGTAPMADVLRRDHRVTKPFYTQWKAARTPQERTQIVAACDRARETMKERAK